MLVHVNVMCSSKILRTKCEFCIPASLLFLLFCFVLFWVVAVYCGFHCGVTKDTHLCTIKLHRVLALFFIIVSKQLKETSDCIVSFGTGEQIVCLC